jgi:hypothetical protein
MSRSPHSSYGHPPAVRSQRRVQDATLLALAVFVVVLSVVALQAA